MKRERLFPILAAVTAVTVIAAVALCSLTVAILGIALPRTVLGDDENGWLAERYREARLAEIRGDQREAVAIYDEVIASDPAYLDAQERRTQVEMELERRRTFQAAQEACAAGNWTEAIAVCRRLQEEQPTYRAAEVRSLLGVALYEEAQRLMDAGQFREALTLLEEARAYHDQAGEMYSRLTAYTNALDALQMGQYNQAIILLEAVYEADPLFLDTDGLLFQAYTVQAEANSAQDWQWALALYDRAMALGGIEDGARQAVRLQREQLAQLHTPTPTATVTLTPTTTPMPTVTPTPTATICPYDYILTAPPGYKSDCHRVAVEGYIVDRANQPINGVRVKVWWDEAPPDWPLSPRSGSKVANGYYEFYLDSRPKDGRWYVAVVNEAGEIVSPIITVHTDAACEGGRQIALVSWRYTRQW